jgi:transposase
MAPQGAVDGKSAGMPLRIPMGWTPPHGIAMCHGSGVETRYEEEASMEKVSIVGLDIAKNRFHAHGAAADGSAVFKRALPRSRVLEFLARMDRCLVALEACAGAHHWGREIMALGHEVRLIPPQYVKPYVKRQKNDAADAEAIAEAASRPSMRFVAVKSAEAQGEAMVLKTRDLLTAQRTQTINALRGHMGEQGIVVPKGPQHLGKLEKVLRQEASTLPATVVALCELLFDQLRGLTTQIDALTARLRKISRENETARRLTTMPGIGPVTAVALATLAPPSETFAKGRDFAAWAGLTPRQNSSGGKTRLGRTSKMGQRDIRRLLIIGAMSVIQAAEKRGGAPAGSWLARMLARKPKMLVAVALANKMARTAWALIARGGVYETPARA